MDVFVNPGPDPHYARLRRRQQAAARRAVWPWLVGAAIGAAVAGGGVAVFRAMAPAVRAAPRPEPRVWSGRGPLNTETFAARADWIVEWERGESRDLVGAGLFHVVLYRAGARDANDVLDYVALPTGPVKGEYRAKQSGRFYLRVGAAPDQEWTVRIRPD